MKRVRKTFKKSRSFELWAHSLFASFQDSCALLASVQYSFNFCLADLSLFNEERSNFSYAWTAYQPTENNTNVRQAFQYTHSSAIDSYPFSGIYTTYQGGGYLYKMLDSNESTISDLAFLQSNNWADRQTRALFFEFSMFNPAVNLFAYCSVLFEFLPSGVILKSMRVSPINLYQFNSDVKSLVLACDFIYLGFVVYLMFREIKELIKLKFAYFKRFWSYIEWLIIGFSWAAFAMYLYRLYSAQQISDLLKAEKSSEYVFIRLQLLSYWDEALGFCLAFCAALASMKLIRLLRFNKRIAVFIDAMKFMMRDLLGFLFLFMLFYLAFVQLLYLTLSTQTVGFSTFVKSMETCFQIMLGKFNVQPIMEANVVLGPLYFSLFNIMMVFVLLNIFVTIVSSSFAFVKLGINERNDQLDVVGYLRSSLMNAFNSNETQMAINKISPVKASIKYSDGINYFPKKVDHLLSHFTRVISGKSTSNLAN